MVRVLLAKLTGLQLVKKFPAFHGNRRFITALTIDRATSNTTTITYTSTTTTTIITITNAKSITSTNISVGQILNLL